jgi:hypothetical protein
MDPIAVYVSKQYVAIARRVPGEARFEACVEFDDRVARLVGVRLWCRSLRDTPIEALGDAVHDADRLLRESRNRARRARRLEHSSGANLVT